MSKLNILIVENESLFALELATNIQKYGYKDVEYATTLKEAKAMFASKDFNLILMDINLADKLDGIELYKSFETDAFVIYLTAYIDEQTISRAIETQPLGYLVKPLKESELLALLKLVEQKLNPIKLEDTKVKLSNEYAFDFKDDTLFHNDKYVKLGSKKIQLLKLLIEARGSVVSFKTIEEELYKENPPSESTLRTLIYRLRKVLNDEMIETEPNYGIRLRLEH